MVAQANELRRNRVVSHFLFYSALFGFCGQLGDFSEEYTYLATLKSIGLS